MSILESTRRQVHKQNNNWYKKAIAINIYHKSKLEENSTYTYEDSGRDLSVSKTYVCESVKLAELISKNPNLIYTTRDRALKYLRSNNA